MSRPHFPQMARMDCLCETCVRAEIADLRRQRDEAHMKLGNKETERRALQSQLEQVTQERDAERRERVAQTGRAIAAEVIMKDRRERIEALRSHAEALAEALDRLIDDLRQLIADKGWPSIAVKDSPREDDPNDVVFIGDLEDLIAAHVAKKGNGD